MRTTFFKDNALGLISPTSPTARVVIPSAEDHDDGSDYESAQEDVEENDEDPLEDFPDHADVRDLDLPLSPLRRSLTCRV